VYVYLSMYIGRQVVCVVISTLCTMSGWKAPPSDKCPKCGKSVYANEAKLGAGSKWHTMCFKCSLYYMLLMMTNLLYYCCLITVEIDQLHIYLIAVQQVNSMGLGRGKY
jgi:LIM domain